VIDCPASSAAAASMPSSAASAALRYFLSVPSSRGPRVRKLGANFELEHLTELVGHVDLVGRELLGHNVVRIAGAARRQEHEGAGEWLDAPWDLRPSLRAPAQRGKRRANSIWASEDPGRLRSGRGAGNRPGARSRVVDGPSPHATWRRPRNGQERGQQHGDVGQDLDATVPARRVCHGRGIGNRTPVKRSPLRRDVPVGPVVDQTEGRGGRRVARSLEAVVTVRLVLASRRGPSGRAAPRRPCAEHPIGRIEAVQRGIGGEEAEGVPQLQQHVAHAVSMAARLARVGVHGDPWTEHPPAQCVRPRVSRIVQGSMMLPSDLDIFAAVGVHDVAEAHHVLVGGLTEHQRV